MTDLLLGDVHAGDTLPELGYDVTATTVVLGALAARDWRPMHHDHDFAVNRNGTQDIFLNTPNQAAWFERYVTDWTGPKGRLGRMKFRMKGSVFPGDHMTFSATVESVSTFWTVASRCMVSRGYTEPFMRNFMRPSRPRGPVQSVT